MYTSIKVKFIPSKNEDKAGTICLQLICKRKTKLIRTRYRLFPAEWDKQNETVRFDLSDEERQLHLLSIKTSLADDLKRLKALILFLENKGDYTVDELAGLFARNSFNGYFFSFMDYVVETLKNSNRLKTANNCITARISFERFLCGQDILIDTIDNSLIQKYERHLVSTDIVDNTSACYMRSLRSVYNKAVKQGLATQKNPFSGINTSIGKTVKRAVSEDVIVRIKTMDLSSHKELALARDLFMFSFYIRGISFIDMANLRKSNLKNGYIIYWRSKTRQLLTVKVEACMQDIITNYESQTIDDYLLPVYTTNNRNNVSQLRNHNKRLKRISQMLVLEKSLSSYVTRHTWATMALYKGVPIEVISESMGHKNETTTRIYLASLNQSIVDNANAEIIKLE